VRCMRPSAPKGTGLVALMVRLLETGPIGFLIGVPP
jgi:hypothetical protein